MLFSKLTLVSLIALSQAKNVVDLSQLQIDLSKREGQEPLFEDPSSVDGIYIPKGEEPQKGPTLLVSGINVNTEISVFAGYVRDDIDVASRFNDAKKQTVVFAPTDSGIETLPLKPWQFPTTVDESKSEEEINAIIQSNVDDFIKSHLVDGEVPFEVLNSERSNLGAKLMSENGKVIKLVNDEGDYYVSSGESNEWLKVQKVTNVDNGAILVIDKPLSSPSLL